MVDWELLRNIAVVITLFGTAITLLKFVLPRLMEYLRMTQKPDKPVTKEGLSWQDVGEGIINILIPEARTFHPHAIFGINRGGAIVGAIIAKKLELPPPVILDIDPTRLHSNIIIENRHDKVLSERNLLLVDDAIRTGSHMIHAIEYLRKSYENIELKQMVVLNLKIEEVGPPPKGRRRPEVNYAYFTYDGRVKLPWDP